MIDLSLLKYLWGDIVWNDGYKLRSIPEPIGPILDIGACVGVFSLWARVCFPWAEIVAVEPHEENYLTLAKLCEVVPHLEVMRAALGEGPVYFREGMNSVTRGYLTGESAAGCSEETRVEVPTKMLPEILGDRPHVDAIIKVDCEGGEQCLIGHGPSEAIIRESKIFLVEFHEGATDRRCSRVVSWLGQFADTHRVEIDMRPMGLNAWLRRK